jgi:hypothetical protein
VTTQAIEFDPQDLADLKFAKNLLENPGLAARITDKLSLPISKGMEMLPQNWRDKVGEATQAALSGALKVALVSMKGGKSQKSHDAWHMLGVIATGGLGGWFGLPGLPIELPVSTSIMMRSVADIARSEGENLREAATVLACIQVFALGGQVEDPEHPHRTSYFAARAAMAKAVTEALEYLTTKGIIDEAAPALLRFIASVAARFSITVSEKALATAVPVLGAAGGALINTLFMDHFQDMAHGHFTVRRLERKYGAAAVEAAYEA